MWLWIVAAAAAGLWWAVNREKGGGGGKGFGRHGGGGGGGGGGKAKRWFNFALFLVALTALMQAPLFGTTLASVGASIVGWVLAKVGLGAQSGALGEIALWILLVAAAIDLKGRKVDVIARTFVVAAPILAIVSSGSLGDAIGSLLSSLNDGSVQVVQDMAQ